MTESGKRHVTKIDSKRKGLVHFCQPTCLRLHNSQSKAEPFESSFTELLLRRKGLIMSSASRIPPLKTYLPTITSPVIKPKPNHYMRRNETTTFKAGIKQKQAQHRKSLTCNGIQNIQNCIYWFSQKGFSAQVWLDKLADGKKFYRQKSEFPTVSEKVFEKRSH